jgi:two-component system chemotaxis sensor kinase CheA
MDARAYLPAFVAEAREHLQELGLAVVRIEADPEDHASAEQVFRVAHTLKGMSATMGFDAIATLTHAMEDVLELLRQRAHGLSREAVDVLSACLDALEDAVERIAGGSEEGLDAAPLVARLQRLARERTPEQELERAGGVALPDLASVVGGVDGRRVVHVVAELADGAAMPGVRAYMLFEALAVHGALVGSVPAPEGVERFAGQQIEAWLTTAADDEAIQATAATIGEIAKVSLRETREERAIVERAASAEPDRPLTPRNAAATVRVDAERLDELLHLMGELVVHRTTVEALLSDVSVPGLTPALRRLTRSSQELQAVVTRVRMTPVEAVFLRFPRLVRDLTARLGKQVELRLEGQETELDRTTVDALADPLVHLIRNALDHGLESPEERVAAGKPATGTLELSARHAGAHVIVSVRDDGRGIDVEEIAHTAFARGLIDADAAAALDEPAALELLFAPGFSTAAQTTDVSGRGIGMDAVRASVRALGGEVTLSSQPGAGTLAQVRLPLTLASIAALLVSVDGLLYAIPLERVDRTLRLADQHVHSVAGVPMLTLHGEVLPLLDAGAALGAGTGGDAREHAVIVRAGERRLALAVGRLLGQRELVTRPLPRDAGGDAAVTSGAVLPDGAIALVIDCDALRGQSIVPSVLVPAAVG